MPPTIAHKPDTQQWSISGLAVTVSFASEVDRHALDAFFERAAIAEAEAEFERRLRMSQPYVGGVAAEEFEARYLTE